MKLPLLAALLAFALSAVSASAVSNAGSFAQVTSTLTLTADSIGVPTVLKNGNKETKATWTTYKVTNAAILAECQRQGLLTAGSVAGWKIFAVFGQGGSLTGFVINNGLQTLWIDSVIAVSRTDVRGFATKGKWVETSTGGLVSGATTYLDGIKLSVSIGGVTYHSTCAPQITDKVVSFGVLSGPVWRPSGFSLAVVGLSNDSEQNESILRGSLTISNVKANWDLGLSLLGFPGFGENDGPDA